MNELEAIEAQREATATIRGYLYQFDASILKILAATASESVTVEGVEDFDILAAGSDTYGQVKYYEAQKLTDATLRDAILPMAKGFLRYTAEERARKKYVLYGHFKQAPEERPTFNLADLQRIFVHRPYEVDGEGGKVRTSINLQEKIGASDADLTDFGRRLSIELTPAFDDHRAQVVSALKAALNVSQVEAEGYSYPSAQSTVAALSSRASKPARTTNRSAFLQSVRPNIAIYSAWALREDGETAYCKRMKQLYFANLNIDQCDRIFVISLPASETLDDLHVLTQHIVSRWSSHKVNKKPDRERYAPIFYFPAIPPETLTALKGRLHGEGYVIADGYPYHGAAFDVGSLLRGQTKDWPVAARFVSNSNQFESAVGGAKREKLVVQLHSGEPSSVNSAVRQITIPISSGSMARKIV